MPTRADVLALRSIEEAFDLWTRKPTRREVALIRVAAQEGLIAFTDHAADAAYDDRIDKPAVWRVVRYALAVSKDVDSFADRQVGINFEGRSQPRFEKRIRVKVSWERRYFIATVHTV